MEMFSYILDKYGVKVALIVFLVKTIYDWIIGRTKLYVKAIDDNTKAINEMKAMIDHRMDKIDQDLQVAFYNIKIANGGKIEMPTPKIDQ